MNYSVSDLNFKTKSPGRRPKEKKKKKKKERMKKTGRGRGKQGRLEDYTEKRGQEEIEGGEGKGRRRQARWACGSGRGLVSRKQNGEDGTQRGSQESPGSAATPTPQLPGPLAHTQPLSR